MKIIEATDIHSLGHLRSEKRGDHPRDDVGLRLTRGVLLAAASYLRKDGDGHAAAVEAIFGVVMKLQPPSHPDWEMRLYDINGMLIEAAVKVRYVRSGGRRPR